MSKYNRRKILKKLLNDGWYYVGTVGSHHHYKHPTKKGKATLPYHSEVSIGTLKGLERQTGIKFL